jgi:hypothetical protein
MRLFTYIFLFICLATTPSVFSVKNKIFFTEKAENSDKIDVSGHWEGTITRDEGGGKRTVYAMDLDLNQKGKELKGISYLHFEDGSKTYHAKMEVKGKINGTYIKYVETRFLNADSIPNADWCIKKADLIHRIQNSSPTLEGIWEGATSFGECIPGRIFLQKKLPKA